MSSLLVTMTKGCPLRLMPASSSTLFMASCVPFTLSPWSTTHNPSLARSRHGAANATAPKLFRLGVCLALVTLTWDLADDRRRLVAALFFLAGRCAARSGALAERSAVWPMGRLEGQRKLSADEATDASRRIRPCPSARREAVSGCESAPLALITLKSVD